eukprot:1133158-Prymnesium_polylepis.1
MCQSSPDRWTHSRPGRPESMAAHLILILACVLVSCALFLQPQCRKPRGIWDLCDRTFRTVSGPPDGALKRYTHAHRSAPVLRHNPVPCRSGGSCPGAVTSA